MLKPKVPVKRMVFHEITKEAIQRAAQDTRDIDSRLVDAQETRRVLDRLYGYEVSPVLWRKVKQGLSAGRVQSVATRMVVERERERMAFRCASYWDVEGEFAPQGRGQASDTFRARLTGLDGDKVATGRDFDDTGALKRAGVRQLDASLATAVAEAMPQAQVAVREVSEKPYTRRPSAPFTTSTLQQEASRKLRLNSQSAMRTAQRLYENGYITLHAHRLDDPVELGAHGGPLPGTGPLRCRVCARGPPDLRQVGQERPGGARGDPPGR